MEGARESESIGESGLFQQALILYTEAVVAMACCRMEEDTEEYRRARQSEETAHIALIAVIDAITARRRLLAR